MSAPPDVADRPEVRRALDYVRRSGSEAPVEAIRRRAGRTFAELDALLEPLDAETAARRPAKGGWSVHEVVDHLILSHRPGLDQLRELLAGRRPATGAVPAGLQSPDPFACPWPRLRADLESLHADVLAALETATDDLPLAVTAPVLMVIKVPDDDGRPTPLHWQEDLDWKAFALTLRVHAHEHLAQVQRVLGEVG